MRKWGWRKRGEEVVCFVKVGGVVTTRVGLWWSNENIV